MKIQMQIGQFIKEIKYINLYMENYSTHNVYVNLGASNHSKDTRSKNDF